MQANYQYVVDRMDPLTSSSDATVLDFGCGVGDIVQAGRDLGFHSFGVEKFYGGANSRDIVEERGLLGESVFELEEDGRIPFDDGYFDLVVSNQVFEHVEDVESVFAEVARVLKPGGQLLGLFPTIGILREVHCNIPIVHWFPKAGRLRYYWLLLFRSLGFGSHKKDKSRREWAADMAEWLNKYTHYRSRGEIKRILYRDFSSYESMEDDYVAFRLQRRGMHSVANLARKPVIGALVREACRRYGGLVFVATRSK